jgi:hypothetical protein
MKKLFSVLLAVLAVVALSFGCNGANEVTGVHRGDEVSPTPTRTSTGPRPTPNPCRQNPADCD